MTELFYDESNSILQELRRGMAAHKGMPNYDQEIVQSVFRGVHTLKASSTMMLFENLSELSKALEQLLFCFRGDGKEITDTERFDEILSAYLDFYEREIDRLSMGHQLEERAAELEEKIKVYTDELTKQMEEHEVAAIHQEIAEPKHQVYYIAGVQDEVKETPKSYDGKLQRGADLQASGVDASLDSQEHSGGGSETVQPEYALPESDKSKKKYVLSNEKREMIFRATRNLQRVVDSLEYSVDESGFCRITLEQLGRLKEVKRDFLQVKKYLTKADFVPVAKKMEVVVDEMSMKLGKRVRLVVKGEHTPVDYGMREKISNALIHIVRNAVDHGIEDMDERERLGKAPVGLIKLKFVTEDGALKITVKDDGRGIDTDGILKNAAGQGFLEKDLSAYSKEEAYKLMLESGVTTTEIPNEYSGRGVGMDVIAHTVEELGGKLKISSRMDEGTTVTMRF